MGYHGLDYGGIAESRTRRTLLKDTDPAHTAHLMILYYCTTRLYISFSTSTTPGTTQSILRNGRVSYAITCATHRSSGGVRQVGVPTAQAHLIILPIRPSSAQVVPCGECPLHKKPGECAR